MLRRFCAVSVVCVAGLLLQQGWSRPWVWGQARKAVEAPATSQRVADKDYELLRRLVDVMDQIERNYVDQGVTREQLLEAAIRGMIKELDPHSNYVAPSEVEAFRTSIDQKFGGIGLIVGVQNRILTVTSPIVGSPAYKAGVQAGDHIVEIEGKPALGMSIDQAVDRLKGDPGTEVSFAIQRPATGERKTIKVKREIVQLETVLGASRSSDDSWNFMLNPKSSIGYIRITAISQETAGQVQRALRRLTRDGMRGLILDLRFNPGGLLTSAVEISDLFVEEGKTIVTVKNRVGKEERKVATRTAKFRGFPMVVLVNGFSASASEVVSACLQDHKQAVIVGQRTWGKASVQQVMELEGGGALKLTTASYHRPTGKNIHKGENAKESDEWGVTPDDGFAVKLSDKEAGELFVALRERDIVHAKGEKPKESEFVDRQLQKAVEHLTTQLAKAE
jgi:carboxyl-terminal processing protease